MAMCAREGVGDSPPIALVARRVLVGRVGHGVPPLSTNFVADRAIVLVEQRQLQAEARLGGFCRELFIHKPSGV